MWSTLALSAVQSSINRILQFDPISRHKLSTLQGKVLRIVIDSPQLSLDIFFDDQKIRIEPTILGHKDSTAFSLFKQKKYHINDCILPATATLHVENTVELLALLLKDEQQLGNIPLQGDYHLLFTLKEIMSQLDVDFASALRPFVGATIAYEVARWQSLPRHGLKMIKSIGFMCEEYLVEDSQWFASRWQMDDLQQQHRQLQQDLDRLDAKVTALKQKIMTA